MASLFKSAFALARPGLLVARPAGSAVLPTPFFQARFFAAAPAEAVSVPAQKAAAAAGEKKRTRRPKARTFSDAALTKLAEKRAATLVKQGKLATAPPSGELLGWYKKLRAEEAAKKAETAAKRKTLLEERAKKAAQVHARVRGQKKMQEERVKVDLRKAKKAANRLAKKGELKTEGWGEEQYRQWYGAILQAKEQRRAANKLHADARHSAIKQQKKGVALGFDPKTADRAVVDKWFAERLHAAKVSAARNEAKRLKRLPFDLATVGEAELLAWREKRLEGKRGTLLKVARVLKIKETIAKKKAAGAAVQQTA